MSTCAVASCVLICQILIFLTDLISLFCSAYGRVITTTNSHVAEKYSDLKPQQKLLLHVTLRTLCEKVLTVVAIQCINMGSSTDPLLALKKRLTTSLIAYRHNNLPKVQMCCNYPSRRKTDCIDPDEFLANSSRPLVLV